MSARHDWLLVRSGRSTTTRRGMAAASDLASLLFICLQASGGKLGRGLSRLIHTVGVVGTRQATAAMLERDIAVALRARWP